MRGTDQFLYDWGHALVMRSDGCRFTSKLAPAVSSQATSERQIHSIVATPVESAQVTSIKFTETIALENLVASIGTIGDA